MPQISFKESDRQIRAISQRVREAEKAKDWGAAIAGLYELLDNPCAHHQVAAYEVWDNIHELHKRAGDYHAAIAAKHEAVHAGYRSVPQETAEHRSSQRRRSRGGARRSRPRRCGWRPHRPRRCTWSGRSASRSTTPPSGLPRSDHHRPVTVAFYEVGGAVEGVDQPRLGCPDALQSAGLLRTPPRRRRAHPAEGRSTCE